MSTDSFNDPINSSNPSSPLFEDSDYVAERESALASPLYNTIPRHRCQIHWYDVGHWTTWMLFGNDDDGIFGEEPTAHYCMKEPSNIKKACKWWCRNPLHNFCFYTIGSANRRNSEFTLFACGDGKASAMKYQPEGKTVFAGEGTSFFLGFHGGKPFVSLRLIYSSTRKGEFYFGWRCRGNFGIKCILYGHRKIEPKKD